MNKTKAGGGSGLAVPSDRGISDDNVLGPEWSIPSQIAREYKGIYSADTIRRRALAGDITYRRSGRKIFIRRSEIEKLLLGKEYRAKRSARR